MANQTIAPAASPNAAKQVAAAPILPESFRPQPDSGPAPEMDAFAELEQIDAGNPAPDSRPPKRQPEAAKPVEKPKDKPATDKPAEKPTKQNQDTPKDDGRPKDTTNAEKPAQDDLAQSGDDPSKKFQLASELRRDYRRLHAENDKLAAKLKEVESGKGAAPSEDRKILDSKIENLSKRNKELEEEISYRDYTKSTEFQEKFKKPFENKLARVYRSVADLTARAEDGTERTATREDFDRVLEASPLDAKRIAKEVFGDEDFREVLQYRRELNELQQNADEEMKGWREKAKEREQTKAAEDHKMREQAEGQFKKSIDTYTEKYPEWFADVEGDDELNKALKDGFTATDRSQDRSVPLAERLDLLAAARLKAASFGRHVITIKRLRAEKADLQAKLKAYEASEPGEGKGNRSGGGGSTEDGPSAADEIDAIERNNPVSR